MLQHLCDAKKIHIGSGFGSHQGFPLLLDSHHGDSVFFEHHILSMPNASPDQEPKQNRYCRRNYRLH